MDPRRNPPSPFPDIASSMIAGNAMTLQQLAREGYAPRAAAGPRSGPPQTRARSGAQSAWVQPTVTGALGVADGLGDAAERTMTKGAKTQAERLAVLGGKAHLAAPGYIYDGYQLATADDQGRAMAGIVGGRVGGALGALVPGWEPVTVPAGAVLGEMGGTYLYDHPDDVRRINESMKLYKMNP